jgi:hypothetical protein
MIKTKNYPKDKDQPWQADFGYSGGGDTGYYNCYFEGYGSTESEAKLNLIKKIDDMIRNLERIKSKQ